MLLQNDEASAGVSEAASGRFYVPDEDNVRKGPTGGFQPVRYDVCFKYEENIQGGEPVKQESQ